MDVACWFVGFEPDIVGVSAGFDTYIEDWGKLLKIDDYRKIVVMLVNLLVDVAYGVINPRIRHAK